MTTSPLSISCTANFNGLMISGQPGRHDWSNKLAKYYTALALAVLLRVYVILYTTIDNRIKGLETVKITGFIRISRYRKLHDCVRSS